MKKYISFIVAICLSVTVWGQSAFSLPKYEKFRLKNGLTVYLMEQHEVPLVYFSMAFKGGAMLDGKKAGLANATADGLMFGTEKYTKAQIEETVDFMGARISTGASSESMGISGYCSVRQQDKIWDILQDMVLHPTFDQTEFEKAQKRALAGLKQAKESPRSVIDAYWNRFLYGEHGYGNPVFGDSKGVQSLTTADLKACYAAQFQPGRGAIAVVGDFKSSEMKSRLEKLFKGWKGSKGKKQPATSTPDLKFSESRVLLVNKSDSRETRFYIGGKGVPRSNPDYVGIQVVNTILGGRFTSWLNEELRINSGLSYGARSRFDVNRMAGTFVVSSFTKTSTTVEAIDLALQVLDRLHTEGPDATTLSSAKNYIKGGFPTDYETSGQLSGLLSDFFIYGFDEAYINEFQKQVDAMDVPKAKEIIRKYFPKDKLQFVLVGKGEEIRDKVRKYGVITEKEITAPGF